MKVVHKNSQDKFYLLAPNYIKLNSIYGYLVGMNKKVFFIYESNEELFSDDVTDDFEIISL